MAKDRVEKALSEVSNGRRGFLKGLLIGSAAVAALPLLKSEAMAQDDTTGKKKKKKKDDSASAYRF